MIMNLRKSIKTALRRMPDGMPRRAPAHTMKTIKTTRLLNSAVACGALLPLSAAAGGIELYEVATPDVGLASAGYASRVQDASVVFRNPGGMGFLDGPQLQVGAQLTYGSVEFSPNANTSPRLGTGDGGNAIGALPGGGLFLAVPVFDKVTVGFATTSYFGLAQKYDDNWVGRYYVQEGALIGVSLLPTVSFRPTEWLSIGAGLNAMYGYFKTQVAVNNLDPTIGDGQMTLKNETWGFGANVGVLVEPVKGTRVGVTYLSPVDLNFKAAPTFSNLGPGLAAVLQNPAQLNLGMTVPQSVMVSVFHELNEKWALMADFGWQNWSQFGKVDVGIEAGGNVSRTVNANYQDTWHGALGGEFKANNKWTFTAGLAYDSSAVNSANRTVTAPMGQAWRFGLGAIYHLNEKIDLGGAYEFLWGGDLSVDQGSVTSLRGRVAGSYNDSWFSFASLNLNWKF
jgi:long-chain fatty acid transport protein